MLKLAVTVVAIALADCINPSLIGGELLFAFGPHPRRRTAAFTIGAWTVTFAFGVAFALGLCDLMGERAERVLRPAGDWLFAHWPAIVGPLTAAIGIAVLAFGVVQLT